MASANNMKTCVFVLLAFFSVKAGNAQQYNNWYFGQKAALSFNNTGYSTAPYTLTNSAMDTRFANSSISDSAGNLLFYTNGETIYNQDHKVMLNGNGIAGSIYSVQGSIIIPHPGQESIYYIFTNDDAERDPTNGYRYSVVDMAGDNGNGRVILKNNVLSFPGSERLTAARHADGKSVWLITNDRFSNVFRAWLINCDGLKLNAVVSTVGEILTGADQRSGMMKVSPDGKQLCQTQQYSIYNTYNDPKRFFQLFDFDNATGSISNPRKIAYNDETTNACEYSPDSKYLYVTRHSLFISGQQTQFSVDQLESKLSSASEIIASGIRIATCFGPACSSNFSTLQAGPDGKIYLNRKTSKLSVISYPNIKGTGCTFELDKIDLGNSGGLGLPSMINDGPADPYNYFASKPIDSCRGIVQFSGQTAIQGTVQWLWDFGDGTTSLLQNPQHTFTPYNQSYKVKLTITSSGSCGYIVRKNLVYPRGIFTKPDFDYAVRCDSGYIRFVNSSVLLPDTSAQSYYWDFGDGNISAQKDPVHSYAASGTYQVKLKMTTATACVADSIAKTIDVQQLNIQTLADQSIDAGQSVQLFVSGGGTSFHWSPSRWLSNDSISNPIARPMNTITYTVSATDDAGCNAIGAVTINVKNQVTGIHVPTAFTPNNDGLNDIIRPLLGSQYGLKEFSIYNRWGQKVYSTAVMEEGWDGKVNSHLQDMGNYVWKLNVTDAQGNTIKQNGIIMLIK
mgnify:FL=1